jgi:Predicted nucleic acid-binding protein, contains PIN domain
VICTDGLSDSSSDYVNLFVKHSTSVIVHHFQRNQAVKPYMERLFNGEAEVAISRITEVELWAGIKDNEVERHEAVLSLMEIVDVDSYIARRAGKLLALFRTQGVTIPDVIVAASAELKGYKLVTANHRHFEPLHNQGVLECEFYIKKG